MPLETRVMAPIWVSRGSLPLDAAGSLAIPLPNELEGVTNGTLANVIRQLSSLSRFAEDVFGGMIRETTTLIARTTVLQGRIDRLSIRVTQLDSAVDEVSIHDIHLKKPFKSSSAYDQQVMNRASIPAALMEQYKCCDKPPPLSKLNQFREDGRDGLKFYTDPGYFFDLWRMEMLQVTERESRVGKRAGHLASGQRSNSKSSANGLILQPNGGGGGGGSHAEAGLGPGSLTTTVSNRQKKPRQPCNTRERYQMQAAQQEFLPLASNACMPQPVDQQSGGAYPQTNGTGLYQSPGAYGTMGRPSSLDISQYTENPYGVHQQIQHANRQSSSSSGSQQQAPLMMQHPEYGYAGTALTQYAGHPGHQQQQQAAPHTPPAAGYQAGSQSQGTPTRRSAPGTPGSHHRPSQPPPAPPSGPSSGSSSGQGTPTAGTPSRGNSRQTSVARDVLPPPPPPPPPPPMPGMAGSGAAPAFDPHSDHNNRCSSSSDQSLPPPPAMQGPPPQGQLLSNINNNIISCHNMTSAKSNGQRTTTTGATAAAAAPPPPPPLPGAKNHEAGDRTDGGGGGPAAMPSFAQQILAKQSQLQPAKKSLTSRASSGSHVVNDARSGLLQAIREGIKLRKVEDSKVREAEKQAPCNDVASILARRVPQELSDSDSDDHSGFESDAWDDA